MFVLAVDFVANLGKKNEEHLGGQDSEPISVDEVPCKKMWSVKKMWRRIVI